MTRQRLRTLDKPKRLICSDLHLTDNLKDRYRWEFLEWLKEKIKALNIDNLYILGDICEKKNHHHAILVNNIIHELYELSKLCKVTLLKGNHDYDKDEKNPFFEFSSKLNNIDYISEPLFLNHTKELFVPHSQNDITTKVIKNDKNIENAKFVYLHQDIAGAKVSDYYNLELGIDSNITKNLNPFFISGHIHLPQKINDNFVFLGAPYPVRFGDTYTGRVLFIDKNDNMKFINYPCLKKWSVKVKSIDDIKNYNIERGDKVQIEMAINQSDFHRWHDIKSEIQESMKANKIDLDSIEMKPITKKRRKKIGQSNNAISIDDILIKYAEQEGLSENLLEIGKELL